MITTRHLILNARVIIAEFGVGCYLRCLKAALLHRGDATFLDSACRIHTDSHAHPPVHH